MLNQNYIEVREETQVPLPYEVADDHIIEPGGMVWAPRGWAVVDVIAVDPYGSGCQSAYCFSTNPKKVWGDWFTLEILGAV